LSSTAQSILITLIFANFLRFSLSTQGLDSTNDVRVYVYVRVRVCVRVCVCVYLRILLYICTAELFLTQDEACCFCREFGTNKSAVFNTNAGALDK
jgi:hypothetical protein